MSEASESSVRPMTMKSESKHHMGSPGTMKRDMPFPTIPTGKDESARPNHSMVEIEAQESPVQERENERPVPGTASAELEALDNDYHDCKADTKALYDKKVQAQKDVVVSSKQLADDLKNLNIPTIQEPFYKRNKNVTIAVTTVAGVFWLGSLVCLLAATTAKNRDKFPQPTHKNCVISFDFQAQRRRGKMGKIIYSPRKQSVLAYGNIFTQRVNLEAAIKRRGFKKFQGREFVLNVDFPVPAECLINPADEKSGFRTYTGPGGILHRYEVVLSPNFDPIPLPRVVWAPDTPTLMEYYEDIGKSLIMAGNFDHLHPLNEQRYLFVSKKHPNIYLDMKSQHIFLFGPRGKNIKVPNKKMIFAPKDCSYSFFPKKSYFIVLITFSFSPILGLYKFGSLDN